METLPKNYKNLEKLLGLMDTQSMSHSDFVAAFEVVMQVIRDLKASNESEFKMMQNALDTLSQKLAQDNSEDAKQMRAECDAMMQDCVAQMEAKLAAMDEKMDAVQDGKDPTVEELQALIRPIVEESIVIDEVGIANMAEAKLEANLPAFGIAFRNALELLPDGEKLSMEAIEGLVDAITKTVQTTGTRAGWGAHPLVIKDGSVVVSKVARILNFGTNLTATMAPDGTITVNASGGGGYTVETPTGTVNGTNVTFTVSATPVYIVIDGITYFQNNGYTLSSLTITTSVPPTGFIRSFY